MILRGKRAIKSTECRPVPDQLTSRRVDKVVGDGSSGPVKNPTHRVGDVAVEAGEERNPCSPGKSFRPFLPEPGPRNSGPYLRGSEGVVDLDVEVALDQLVGRTQARDTTAEDDDLRVHGSRSKVLMFLSCAEGAHRPA